MSIKVCQLSAVDFTLNHFLIALIDGMAAEGWHVTAVCSDGPFIPGLRQRGYRVETIAISRGLNPLKHLVSLLRLYRLFRKERFDILHAHTPVAALLGRIAARLAGIPLVIYTAHGFYFHDRMRTLPRIAYTWLEWLGGRMTDLLFTQSAEDAATAVALGIADPTNVVAIGNGVDVRRFEPDQGEARAATRLALGIPETAIVIGIIGRMVAEKGYREFCSAASVIAQKYPEAWFVAVGDRLPSDHATGVERDIAQARARVGNRLVLTGLRSDVPDLLAAFDIFTLPSYREGMPRTIIEAMMMGLPVVATDIRGSREEVVDEETGLLVPPADADALCAAMELLVNDVAARSRMGKAGRRRALELFDESKVVAKQINSIKARLSDPPRSRERF